MTHNIREAVAAALDKFTVDDGRIETFQRAVDAICAAVTLTAEAPSASAQQAESVELYTGGSFIRYVDLPAGFKMEHLGGDRWRVISAPAPSASPAALTDALTQIGAILGPGSNELHILLACIRNIKHFADCLDAVERAFFMVLGEPDEDDPDSEPGDECLLNRWGSTVEQYVEQFRAAIPHLLAASPAAQVEDARDAARYLEVPAHIDAAFDEAFVEAKEEAKDAARYRFLCAHPDWKFIEDICRSFVAESAIEFRQGLSLAIDAAMSATPPAAGE